MAQKKRSCRHQWSTAICVKTDKLGGLKRIEYQTVTVLKMYCAITINIKMFGKQFVQYKESAI